MQMGPKIWREPWREPTPGSTFQQAGSWVPSSQGVGCVSCFLVLTEKVMGVE